MVSLLLCIGLCTQAAEKAAPSTDLQSKIDSILSRVSSETLVSMTAGDVKTDTFMCAVNSGKNMLPASTQKLFTTWTALVKLTPAYRCTTSLYFSGKLQGSILKGNLIIRGRGDPAFASRFFGKMHGRDSIFSSWHSALRKTGIKEIHGCVMGDDSHVENFTPNPYVVWQDMGNYYGGITSGLCFNDNRYRIFFTGSKRPGDSVVLLRTEPERTGITRFHNKVKTGPVGSRDLAFIFGSPLAPERKLRGTYPAGKKSFSIQGSLPRPAWTCALEFRDYLQSRNMLFRNAGPPCSKYEKSPPGSLQASWKKSALTPVAGHVSPSLSDLIGHVNRRSDNTYAEQLLCLLSRETGNKGNYREGLAIISDYLQKQDFDPIQYHFRDGSGLSRHNWVSGYQFARLLRLAAKHTYFPHFRNSLKTATSAGADLAGLGKGWHDRLWIKTGSMQGIYALAGYLKTDSGQLVCFHICFNNSSMKYSRLREVTASVLRTIRELK
jgi:D-alanyl-D-alanine carboxypeptidase/D-alanyl-D-alanine-endopeptidase (penicillin-binding protein 4)